MPTSPKPTLIVGAGAAGRRMADALLAETPRTHAVVGFLDDKWPDLPGHSEIPVLGRLDAIAEVVASHRIDTILICIAGASNELVGDLVARSRHAGARTVRAIGSNNQVLLDQVRMEATHPVTIEDLFVRQPVAIDKAALDARLAGQRVLVTGAAGTIGSELCRQLALCRPARLTLLDTDESRLHDLVQELLENGTSVELRAALVDIRDAGALDMIFERDGPAVVFHAAAYKHVPLMEDFPLAALEVNVIGTANLVEAGKASGVQQIILISTDKAVEPTSIMGASKRAAEHIVLQQSAPKGTAVRFGNVLGSRGSVVPTFQRQIERGHAVTVTHPDVERYFMDTSEAVALVLQAFLFGRGGDIYLLRMGRPIRILDLARAMITARGLVPEVDVPIRFVGLRDGEKLQETLSHGFEKTTPTEHARILRVATAFDLEAGALVEQARAAGAERSHAVARAFLSTFMPAGPAELHGT